MTLRRISMPLAAFASLVFLTLPALAQEDDEDPEPEVSDQGPADDLEGPGASDDEEDDAPPSGDEADPEPEVSVAGTAEDPYDRILAASATLGIDSPLGVAGAAVEVSPIRWLAVYAGLGVGRDGFRVAGGIRPQIPVGEGAIGLMLGLTGGPLDWDSNGASNQAIHRYWEFALFFHTGLTVEYRWAEGLFGRLAIGVESQLAPDDANSCTFRADGTPCGPAGTDLMKPIRAWAGLTVGYAFDL